MGDVLWLVLGALLILGSAVAVVSARVVDLADDVRNFRRVMSMLRGHTEYMDHLQRSEADTLRRIRDRQQGGS